MSYDQILWAKQRSANGRWQNNQNRICGHGAVLGFRVLRVFDGKNDLRKVAEKEAGGSTPPCRDRFRIFAITGKASGRPGAFPVIVCKSAPFRRLDTGALPGYNEAWRASTPSTRRPITISSSRRIWKKPVRWARSWFSWQTPNKRESPATANHLPLRGISVSESVRQRGGPGDPVGLVDIADG